MSNSSPPTLLFWSQKCIIWNTTERTIASCLISKLKTAHSVCEEEHASLGQYSFGMQQSNEYIHQTSLLSVMAPWNRSAWKKGEYFLGLLNIVSEDPNCYPNPSLWVKINSGEETNTETSLFDSRCLQLLPYSSSLYILPVPEHQSEYIFLAIDRIPWWTHCCNRGHYHQKGWVEGLLSE